METRTQPRRLRDITLRVQNVDRVVEFYRDVLGLRLLEETKARAGFGPPEGRPLVWLEHTPDAVLRRRASAGLFHLALRVPDEEALSHVLRRFDAHDYRLEGASDHLVSEALYTRDPEGNGIEIYRDRPHEAWTLDPNGAVVMDTMPLNLQALRERTHGTLETAIARGADLGHVHLEVSDLETSRRFYAEVLGMSPRAQWRGARFVAWNDYHHHVGLNTWRRRTRPLSPDETGVANITGELESSSDVARIAERATREGVEVFLRDERAVLRDPDGVQWTVTGPRG